MGLPQCVRDAKKIDFGVPISGYLCCAEFQPPCVIGVFFSETPGRFADGKTIRSSKLERVFQVKGYQLCETLSGSRYLICHWWYENGALPAFNIIH
ncbi:hypothetical protein EAH72_27350 [Pseudomonas caspiana]|nr:hypothetical protein EAH72_27350 [Pseudomonas caspiana]